MWRQRRDRPLRLLRLAKWAEGFLPSIVPHELTDSDAMELEMLLRWFSSDRGQDAKIEAALG
jgi:hypothetical protein